MGQIVVHYVWLGILLFFVAFMIVWTIFPTVMRMARVWNMYDNPDARKLQRRPVPVLGGLAVFFGIATGFLIICSISFSTRTIMTLVAMAALLVVGIIDDKKGLPVALRFIIEIGVILGMMLLNGNMIDHFHGLFGLEEISPYVAYPLSVIAGVGIINAINLIDGVDGYSSGFMALACILFAVIFYEARIFGMAIMCLICTGAVVPFFIHNVFGKRTKMFIGDGGTLMMGTLMTAFVFSVLRKESMCGALEYHNIGLVPTCIAILSIPIADTLRVMTTRIAKGHSPFHPDKTHLHHLFIDFGFSHVGTAFTCLLLNCIVVLSQLIAWVIGASIDTQMIVVCGMGLLLTFALYPFMRHQQVRHTKINETMRRIGDKTHFENTPFWHWMQKLTDDDLFSEGKEEKTKFPRP